MAELMDKQGILDELRRRSGGAQQEQTPMMDKQQILDYLRQRSPGQGAGTFSPVTPGKSAKDFVSHLVPEKESQGYFQAGMLDDKDKNVAEKVAGTYVGTAADVSQNVYSSGLGMGEKVLDFLATIAPYIAAASPWGETAISAPTVHRQAQQQQLESGKQLASEFVEKDLYDEDKIARKIVTDPLKKYTGIDADTDSVLGEKSDAVVQSLAQMAATAAMGGTVPWWVVTGATSFGGEAENALKQGATLEQAGLSAAASAGAEILTEKLFGGSGLGEKGFLNLDVLTKKISNKLVKTMMDYGVDMAAEGAEEVVSSFASNLASSLYREENLSEILFSEEALQEYLDSFVSGAAVGGLMNAGKVGSSIANKTDYRNGLTAQEQKVFDTEYNAAIAEAKKNGKLTKEQKAEIYDSVLEDVISRRPAPKQAATPTQSEETVQAEKVPTQAETPTQAAQAAQTPSQPMTPQQAMQETIAETIGVPSVSKAVESFRQNGKVSNSQAEAIIADDGVFREILEMTGIAPPTTKSESRAAVKQAVAKLAQESTGVNANIASESTGADATIAETVVPTDSTTTARPEIRNDEAWEEYQRRLAEWEARQNQTGGFSSVGAANAGFSKPSPVDPLIEQYGSLPSGENPVRSDELPQSVTGQDRVSQTAVTVKGAQATPDDFVDMLDEDVAKGGMSYIPIKNSNTTQEAVDYITREGWTQALANWTAAVNSGKSGSDLVAQGALLLNNAASAGNKQQWLDILHTYQKLGTNTAQGLQAMRILKTLAPSEKLYMIRRSVKQMVDDMKLDTDIVLDEGLMESYRNAETDAERDEILSQIQQSVADQIPSTFMEKFTALRYVNMLGNLRTQARNIVGNVAMKGVSSIKNAVASGIEDLAYRVSGGKFKKTKSFTVSKAQLASAMADFADIKSAVMGSGRYVDSRSESTEFAQGVQDKRTIFKSDNKVRNTTMKPLEGYRKVTNWAMEQGDLFFAQRAYARALAGYIKAQGISETNYAKISPAVMEDARLYAAQEAREQTFRDTNWLSGWVSKVGRRKDTPKAVKVISEGIMPFRKTPANVLVRAEEYSPLGIINSVYYSIQAARKGADVTGAQVVNSWAKSLTGTGLFALGMLLQSLGVLTTGPDEDENKESFESLSGWQNYAIVLPDGTNVTIDFLTPSAMPLLMGAELKSLMEDGGISVSDLESALTSIGEPMVQMSMLQGVSDALDNVQYAKNNLGQFVINSALSYLTQGLTNTALGQLERGFESSRNTTYVDKESGVPDWLQKALGKASAKTPIWEYNQIPYINAWGEEEENLPTGLNLAYNLLSPGYVESGKKDALTEELNRLGTSTGENVYPDRAPTYITVKGKDINFSAEEYVSFAKDMGQTQKKLLEQVLSVPGYEDLPDAQKVKVVKEVYQYAKATAAERAVPEYDASIAKWMRTAGSRGNLAEAIIDRISENAREKELEEKKEAAKEAYLATKNGQ